MAFNNATNNYATSRFIVSSVAGQGNYTTIQSAITAASSGNEVIIMPGTYTENLTLKSGVNLACWTPTGEFGTPSVTIVGKMIDGGSSLSCSFQNIAFQTNSDYILELTGATSSVQFHACNFSCLGNPAINMSSTSQNVFWYTCYANIGSTGSSFFSITAGDFWIYNSQVDNSGSSTTVPTFSNGLVYLNGSVLACPLDVTSTGVYEIINSTINTSALNVTCLTANDSSIVTSNYTFFSSGSASAISINDTSDVTLSYQTIASSNTYYIT